MRVRGLIKRVGLGIFLLVMLCLSAQAQYRYIYTIRAAGCPGMKAGEVRILTGFKFRFQSQTGIATALHGVCGCSSITAQDHRRNTYKQLDLVLADIDSDVAVLTSDRFRNTGSSGLTGDRTLSSESLKDQVVTIYGHPLGLEKIVLDDELRVRKTPVVELKRLLETEDYADLKERSSPALSKRVLNLSGNVLPGHSGAPVIFNDKVIAVVNGGLRGGTVGTGWAVPLSEIDPLPLAKLRQDPRWEQLISQNSDALFSTTSSRFFEPIVPFADPDENLNVLVLAFDPLERCTNKETRIERTLEKRLLQLGEKEAFNVQVISRDELIYCPLTEQEARDVGEEFEADIVIYGDYYGDCGSNSKIDVKYVVLWDWNDDLVDVGGTGLQPLSSLADLAQGALLNEIDYIVYWAGAAQLMQLDEYARALKYLKQIRREFKDVDFGLYYDEIYCHYNDGQLARCNELVDSLLINRPNNIVLLQVKGALMHFLENDATAGIDYIERALALEPDNGDIHELYALLQFVGPKEYDLAMEHLMKAAELSPDNPSIYSNIGAVLMNGIMDYDSARVYLEKAINLDSTDARYLANWGATFLGKGFVEAEKGVHYLRKALKADPEEAIAWSNLGAYHNLFMNDIDSAIYCYRKAIELDSMQAYPYVGLADVLRSGKGDVEGAEAALKRALHFDSLHVSAHYEYAELWLMERSAPEIAMDHLDKCDVFSNGHFSTIHLRAIAHTMTEPPDIPAAIAGFEQVLARDSSETSAYASLSAIYLQEGYPFEKFLDLIEAGLRFDPGNVQLMRRKVTYLIDLSGRAEEGMRYMEACMQKVPDNADLMADHALYTFNFLDDTLAAIEVLNRVLAIDSGHSSAWSHMAYLKSQTPAGAAEAFAFARKALKLMPTNTMAISTLASLYVEAGKVDSALYYLDRLETVDPLNAGAADLRAEIYQESGYPVKETAAAFRVAYATSGKSLVFLQRLAGFVGDYLHDKDSVLRLCDEMMQLQGGETSAAYYRAYAYNQLYYPADSTEKYFQIAEPDFGNTVAYRLQYGFFKMNQGEYATASSYFDWAVKRQPDNAVVWFAMAVCAFNQDFNDPQALSYMRKALRLDPDRSETLRLYGAMLMQQVPEARDSVGWYFARAIAADSLNMNAWTARAVYLEDQTSEDALVQMFVDAFQAHPELEPQGTSAATQLDEYGNPRSAGAIITALYKVDSTDPYRILNYAKALESRYQQPVKALPYYQKVTNLWPDSSQAWVNMAAIRINVLGDTAGALAAIREAYARTPNDPQTLTNYAVMEGILGQNVDSVEARLLRVLTMVPEHQHARQTLVHLYQHLLPDDEKLVRQADEMVQLDPSLVSVYMTVGLHFADQGKFEKMVACLEKYLLVLPDDEDVRSNLLQVQLEMLSDSVGAQATIDELLRRNPQNTIARIGKTILAIGEKDYLAATRYATEVTEIDPAYTVAWFWKGEGLRLQGGREAEAIEAYRRCLRDDPGLVLAVEGLMRLLAETGMDRKGLIAEWEGILAKIPDYVEGRRQVIELYSADQMWEDVKLHSMRLVMRDPDDLLARYQLATSYFHVEPDSNRTRTAMQDILTMDSSYAPAWFTLAVIELEVTKNLQKASEYILRGLAFAPGSPELNGLYAELHYQDARFFKRKTALRKYKQACADDPRSIRTYLDTFYGIARK